MKNKQGFTLLEVLIALAIMSIAITALLLATAENIRSTEHLKHRMLARLVANDALAQIQLNLIPLKANQEIRENLTLFNTPWFWRAKAAPTPEPGVERLTITVSKHEKGPFTDPLLGFRRKP